MFRCEDATALKAILVCTPMGSAKLLRSYMSSAEWMSVLLQGAGVLVSRKAHGAHHRAPFEGNYCIVSGFWNPILDAGGSPDGFFRRLERFVADRTGVEPRCWYEPDCALRKQLWDWHAIILTAVTCAYVRWTENLWG